MPPFTIETLPNESIILITVFEDYQLSKDLPEIGSQLRPLLAKQDHPVYLVLDISKHAPITINDMMVGTESLAYGSNALFHHPNVREVAVVTQNETMRTAFQGATNEVFGNLKINLFDTLDEAFAYIRK